MHSIEEKRVYADRSGATHAYVASGTGVVRVQIAGDAVGEFSLLVRCEARDLAASEDGHLLAVATAEDVVVCRLESGDRSDTDPLEVAATGFGPAVAVGIDGDELLAAGPDGRLARTSGVLREGSDDGPNRNSSDVSNDDSTQEAEVERLEAANWEWDSLPTDPIDEVRSIDRDLVGTDDGVYRVRDAHLDHAGLRDVHDVSAAGIPLAAATDGLYKLGNGWMAVLEGAGAFDRVEADATAEFGALERAHAVAGETLFELGSDDEWRPVTLPDPLESEGDRIVGVAYGESIYAATENGRVLARRDDGDAAEGESPAEGTGPDRWRVHTIGVRDVTAIVCGPDRSRPP